MNRDRMNAIEIYYSSIAQTLYCIDRAIYLEPESTNDYWIEMNHESVKYAVINLIRNARRLDTIEEITK